MAMQILLEETAEGFRVLGGQLRLNAALTLRSEVLVESPGIGEVLIAKLPDGRMVATQDQRTIALLGC